MNPRLSAFLLTFLLKLLLFTLTGCISSSEPEVSYPLEAREDPDYAPALQKATAHFDVIENFETKIKVHITYLNPEFRQAMAQRYQRIFSEALTLLTDASQKTGFFVSIYTASRELNELSNRDLWKIRLEQGGSKLEPSRIERLTTKDRWSPFFPDINIWSHEYLLLFDLAPAAGAAKQNIFLNLSSADGSVRSEW